MNKTVSSPTTLLTDHSLVASGEWTSTSGIDTSSIVGYLSLELQGKGSSVQLSGDITLKILASIDGTTFTDSSKGIPLITMTNVNTTYESKIEFIDITPYKEVKVYINNSDDTNAATVSLSYSTVSL